MQNLIAVLEELASLPASEQPYLSIYLDWRTDGSGKHHARRVLEDELNRLGGEIEKRGEAHDSFEADHQRILQYLDNDAPRDAMSLTIFACDAVGLWKVLPLQVAIDETEVVLDRQPHLFQLARIVDDFETTAVVVADSQESRILLLAHSGAQQVGQTEAAEEIRRFDAGGPSQMIFQHRTEKLVKDHSKDMALALDKVMQKYAVSRVVIVGNDAIKGAVMGSLSEQVKAKVIDYISLEQSGGLRTLMEAVMPLVEHAERQQEQLDVAQLEEQAATKGGLAAVGISDTAMALTKGQVRLLLMLPSFDGPGGECANCGALRAGQRDKCPMCGGELQPVTLREAFTTRTLQQSATLQVVEQSEFLEQHDGVGALLWYNDTQQGEQRTAERGR